ncbi:MAG: beta-propeller domain-containing protein [Lachnospiraceae bacterium]|nr:beta-propeller domain-containing protein [Lachnospiraceae bacterium]
MKKKMKGVAAVLLAVELVLAGGCGKTLAGQETGGAKGEAGMFCGMAGFPVQMKKEGSIVAEGLAKAKKELTGRFTEPEEIKENGEGADINAGDTGFLAAKNYQEILDVLRTKNDVFHWEMYQDFALDSVEGVNGGVMNDAVAKPGTSEEIGASGKDYSDTNAQVEGIAEADIVKTDGEYIYILSKKDLGTKIYIVQAKDGTLALESSFSPEKTFEIWQEEMYVSGNHLVVVRYGAKRLEGASGEDDFIDVWFGYHGERQTEVLIYDITDRKAPFLAGSHVQDGDYVSSRKKDGYLYVISQKDIYNNVMLYMDRVQITEEITIQKEEGDVSRSGSWDINTSANTGGRMEDNKDTSFRANQAAGIKENKEVAGASGQEMELSEEDLAKLPQVDGVPVAPGCIYFRGDGQNSGYTIVTAVCLDTPKKPVESISFMAGSGHCYMSGNAIYLGDYNWYSDDGGSDHTDIVKISYADGQLEFAAQGIVKGSLDDQFSMDEKDGYLRIVTTVEKYKSVQEMDHLWKRYLGRSNALYVLDQDLKVVGCLEDLAEDERIYSARFIGDTAYFVTFRNTDPLFSVDVSNPANPVLLGALKIPGFSDYLHPYGENLLLGIGYDADETGIQNGVKLTMFDISDPYKVVEKHTLTLDCYDSSEACYNHRAVLVDKERGLIGLPFEGSYHGEDGYRDYMEKKGYVVYGYDGEKGFYQRFEKDYVRKWNGTYYYDIRPGMEEDVQQEPSQEEIAGGEVERLLTEPVVKYQGTVEEDNWNNWYYMRLRGVYIGDYFYLVNQIREICSYRMGQDGFSEVAQMELR